MSDEQAVKVGDRFMVLTPISGYVPAGEILSVDLVTGGDAKLCGYGQSGWVWADDLLHSGDWRRVPPGYVVPPIGDLLAGIVDLALAYRAMLADPETGAKGIDATVREMARLGGIEVTW